MRGPGSGRCKKRGRKTVESYPWLDVNRLLVMGCLRPGWSGTWQWPDGNWEQELFFGAQPEFKDIGQFDSSLGSLRAWIDSKSRPARKTMLTKRAAFPRQVLVKLSRQFGDVNDLGGDASKAHAVRLRAAIEGVRTRR